MAADGYALLVVDMQNGFCHRDGSFPRIGRGLEGAMDAVANAASAIGQARRAGVPVVFTRHVYRPGRPDEGAALIRNSPELAGVAGLADGTWDAAICAELGCGPDDLVVDKVRFDAFQWTSLGSLTKNSLAGISCPERRFIIATYGDDELTHRGRRQGRLVQQHPDQLPALLGDAG
jgi:nicotinamidase-related amidase